MIVRFDVPGNPVSSKRPRFAAGRTYMPRENLAYKGVVQWAWHEQRPAGFEPYPAGVPLLLDVVCFFERPKSHYGTGRNAGRLKPNAPRWHTSGNNRGDVDNLVKAVADALKGLVWHDDGQVASAKVAKLYDDGQGPRASVFVRELD